MPRRVGLKSESFNSRFGDMLQVFLPIVCRGMTKTGSWIDQDGRRQSHLQAWKTE